MTRSVRWRCAAASVARAAVVASGLAALATCSACSDESPMGEELASPAQREAVPAPDPDDEDVPTQPPAAADTR